MLTKPIVIIYRDHLLRPSETFIRSQAEALNNFIPYYAGSRIVRGLELPKERTITINQNSLIPDKAIEIAFKLWGFAPFFLWHLQKLKPAAVHAHFGSDGVRALPLVRSLKVPLIVTFHGFDATVNEQHAQQSFYGHRVYLRQRKLLQQKGQKFIAVSKFIRDKLLEQGFPPDKTVVHYIGVDVNIFHANPAVSRKPVVLFVGRLVEKKGCEYLIQAMRQVQALMPEVELVVIGDGPLRSSLEKLAGEMLQRFQFLGVQPVEKVKAWMNQAQVFCVPSITARSGDSEGFGIVFAEAQSMELPVVSFANGGISEAVAHGETGFLAAEYNWEELASYIMRLLQDKSLWHQFSQSGKRRVQTLFNLQKQTIALEEIYNQVTSESKESTKV